MLSDQFINDFFSTVQKGVLTEYPNFLLNNAIEQDKAVYLLTNTSYYVAKFKTPYSIFEFDTSSSFDDVSLFHQIINSKEFLNKYRKYNRSNNITNILYGK
jgi:hypothetical protein